MTIKTPLPNHKYEPTAYVVDDYPYGFRLRCKIRYWIEFNPKHGFRFCSQTTNPKKSQNIWNRPKKSTYSKIAMGMYLDENDHVQTCALSEYSSLKESIEFKERFFECLSHNARISLDHWIAAKTAYNEAKKRGDVTCTIGDKTEVLEPELI